MKCQMQGTGPQGAAARLPLLILYVERSESTSAFFDTR